MGYRNINMKDSGKVVCPFDRMKEERNNWCIKNVYL
jgi:hypothetical protein